MEYVIPIVIVMIAVTGFVTFLVINATSKRSADAAGDKGTPGIGQDETPLGDTSEHAGRQTDDGATVGDQDADSAGGSGRPTQSGYDGTSGAGEVVAQSPTDSAHVARPGEGEGRGRLEFEDHEPREDVRRQAAPGSQQAS
jgi:hypothetical protein